MFASKQAKYWHTKNVKCQPVNHGPTQIINNNGNNITNNNDNSQNITNNIINNFYGYNHDHVEFDRLKTECRALKSSIECITKYLELTFFNPDHPESRNVSLTNMRPDYKFIDVFNDGRWIKDVQLSVLKDIINRSMKLTRQLLQEEDPDYEPDYDVEHTEEDDNLKNYDRNYVTNFNKFKKRMVDRAKKDIYNNCAVETVATSTSTSNTSKTECEHQN